MIPSLFFSKVDKQTSIRRLYTSQTNQGRICINLVMVAVVRGNEELGKEDRGGELFCFYLYFFYHHLDTLPHISATYSKQPDFPPPMYYLLKIM